MGPLIEHSWQSYVYFLDFLFIFSVIIKAADFPDSVILLRRVDFSGSINTKADRLSILC